QFNNHPEYLLNLDNENSDRNSTMNFGKKKKNAIEEIDESYNSYLSAPDGEIIEKSSGRDAVRTVATGLGGGIKFIIGVILLIVLVVGTSYTLLGGTLMFLAPNSDS